MARSAASLIGGNLTIDGMTFRGQQLFRAPTAVLAALLFLLAWCARAQNALAPDPPTQSTVSLSAPSPSEKWNFFITETVNPLLLVAVIPDATASQLTRSSPLYGKHPWKRGAFPKRFGATLGDDVTQNFFADFVFATAFHEDTRYVREGPSHGAWRRVGYAISRAVITRTDSGTSTFNWANVVGCGASAALSNAYYPPVSRTAKDSAVNWGTNIAGAGLTNLMPWATG